MVSKRWPEIKGFDLHSLPDLKMLDLALTHTGQCHRHSIASYEEAQCAAMNVFETGDGSRPRLAPD